MNWLKRKFLLVLENQVSFNRDTVEEHKITKSSRLVWNILSPQLRTDAYNKVELTKLELDDDYATLQESFELEIFKINRRELKLYDYNDDVQLAITYEFNRD